MWIRHIQQNSYRDGRGSGFTIVELLVTIVVIAILATISIVAYNGIQDRAVSSKNKTQASEVAKKAELWSAFIGSYPTYAQMKTNTLSPTMPGGVPTPGGAAGPSESKLSAKINLTTGYPIGSDAIGYIQCATPGGGYAIYYDPASNDDLKAYPIGLPATAITYGSMPTCG